MENGGGANTQEFIRLDYLEASPQDMLAAVRAQGLEGVIGKRKDSLYEPGKRSGAWIKHRVNAGQEFVIGGYIPGGHGVDSIIVGFYRDKKLIYVARFGLLTMSVSSNAARNEARKLQTLVGRIRGKLGVRRTGKLEALP